MNVTDIEKIPETPDVPELEATTLQEVAGGGDLCSADQLVALTGALKESYENLVDFTSHVIERVAGSINT